VNSTDTDLSQRLLPTAALALPIHLLQDSQLAAWLADAPEHTRRWLQAQGFKAERGRWLAIPAESGATAAIVTGLGNGQGSLLWLAAGLAERLPAADYRLASSLPAEQGTAFTLGWLLGGYRYERYRTTGKPANLARLSPPAGADITYALAAAGSELWARDLINTPANDLGPDELQAAAGQLCQQHGGQLTVTSGPQLTADYPLIAAVGRASPRAPRLLDLLFAKPGAPRITLVGKGVCFDTGGLDIKPAAGMQLMKKDMGGAACVLALARLLRTLSMPIELRVLIAAVDNSIAGDAFRPGDVLRSRQGLSVEIGNTDAEGRLVLADALTLAAEQPSDLLIDLATLTGAARVALGSELPAVYSGDPALANAAQICGLNNDDPLWAMPLWRNYEEDISSRIADLNNAGSSGLAGSITAALFLRRFVGDPSRWLHIDLYAWNPRERAGRPVGGEAQAVRALYALLQQRYG